ncbi:TIGR02757 family protein [Cloacibacterium sp.]|uniref:TIGR02757 family protein n=1 Tax=Cloacibacterium sp. TaxID=1913682 RepID=UPI0039E6BE7B
MNEQEIFDFLNQKAEQYNHLDFIELDPISIPHQFSLKQDIEISAFFSATIAWGNRKSIITSAQKIINFMGNSPYDFVMNASEKDLEKLDNKAVHRTFSGEDFKQFLLNLKRIYTESESLENLFLLQENEENYYHSIERFRNHFLGETLHRSHKHVSSPYKNSASKRLVMFLRWMVRQDKKGVDFGIWKNVPQKYLSIPLDVHTANISRKLGILSRTQNDWKAVEELDKMIRKYNSKDPAIYDFALFGIGVSKEF